MNEYDLNVAEVEDNRLFWHEQDISNVMQLEDSFRGIFYGDSNNDN